MSLASFLATVHSVSFPTRFRVVRMWYPLSLWWPFLVGIGFEKAVCPVFGNIAFAKVFLVDSVQLNIVLFLSSSVRFLISKCQILWGLGALSFPLL